MDYSVEVRGISTAALRLVVESPETDRLSIDDALAKVSKDSGIVDESILSGAKKYMTVMVDNLADIFNEIEHSWSGKSYRK